MVGVDRIGSDFLGRVVVVRRGTCSLGVVEVVDGELHRGAAFLWRPAWPPGFSTSGACTCRCIHAWPCTRPHARSLALLASWRCLCVGKELAYSSSCRGSVRPSLRRVRRQWTKAGRRRSVFP